MKSAFDPGPPMSQVIKARRIRIHKDSHGAMFLNGPMIPSLDKYDLEQLPATCRRHVRMARISANHCFGELKSAVQHDYSQAGIKKAERRLDHFTELLVSYLEDVPLLASEDAP